MYPEVGLVKEKHITKKAVAAFRLHLAAEEKSTATTQKYLRDVAAFAAYAGSAPVTRQTVAAFKRQLLADGYAVRSVNSMLASLNSLFAFLGWHDCRAKNIRMQPQAFCAEEKELTRAEYERLCQAARQNRNERLLLVLQTVCGTGIRVSELPFITVEAAQKGEAAVSLKGKTRTVFLVRALRGKLLRYAAAHGIKAGPIFITRTGRPMDRTNVWRQMKGLCAQAGVSPSKVFPHNLRHLFARVFYAMEKDIAKLADLLGHSSIDTTRIYIVSSGREHRRRMEAMQLVL